jgi:hypothetical protein
VRIVGFPNADGGYRGVADIAGRKDCFVATDTENVTGTSDPEYNVLWFTEACLKNAQRLQTYISDAQKAGNEELVEFFRKAQAESRKGAEMGKQMLRTLLDAGSTSTQ